MIQVKENISLKHLNTFGIDVNARYYAEVFSVENIRDLISGGYLKDRDFLILGGGSNILFTNNVEGIVIKNEIRGITLIKEDNDSVFVRAGAGELWHHLVSYCIAHDYAGIENLSLIPGSVGAAPIQNIGAYGVELKDVFWELEGINIQTTEVKLFTKEDCHFGYRNSIFKKELKNQYIITHVTLKLKKQPVYNISYGAIESELQAMGVSRLSIKAIGDAVCNIRLRKLPDPLTIGNAGSFFKNPEIDKNKFEQLKQEYPDVVGHDTSEGKMKLAAGWLVEQCGWKGKRIDDAGIHQNQALVLVNYGNAKGEEVYRLALQVQQSVKDKFGVLLETEVNIM